MSLSLTGCAKKARITRILSLNYSYTQGYAINSRGELSVSEKNGAYEISVKLPNEPEESRVTAPLGAERVRKIEAVFEQYKVGKWNGFQKSNKMVLDGNSFSLSVTMEGEQEICASGYMKWPANYREVSAFLQALMKEFAGTDSVKEP